MNGNLVHTRSIVTMLKMFMCKDLAIQYTAKKKSITYDKIIMKGLPFTDCIESKFILYYLIFAS